MLLCGDALTDLGHLGSQCLEVMNCHSEVRFDEHEFEQVSAIFSLLTLLKMLQILDRLQVVAFLVLQEDLKRLE